MAEYKPKSKGIRYLKHQVSSAKRRLNIIGIKNNNPIVSMPLKQAESLIVSMENNKIRLDTMNKLTTRLSSHLDSSHKNYNRAVLRELAETILLVLSEIE